MTDTGRTPEQDVREALSDLADEATKQAVARFPKDLGELPMSLARTNAAYSSGREAIDRLVAEHDEARQAEKDANEAAELADAWRERCDTAEARVAALREALAEASTHVHDCEELLTPATRRAVAESVAAVTTRLAREKDARG